MDVREEMVLHFWRKYGENARDQECEPEDDFTTLIDYGDGQGIREYRWAIFHYFDTAQEWGPEVLEALEYARGKLLDVGCCCGRFLKHFTDLGADIIGIDNEPVMIQICRERGLQALLMDIQDTPFADETFDTILMMGNMVGCIGETAQEIQASYREILRILKPGGRVIGTTYFVYTGENRTKRGRYKWNDHVGEEKIGWYLTPAQFEHLVAKAVTLQQRRFQLIRLIESQLPERTTFAYVLEGVE